MTKENKRVVGIVVATTTLLLVPLLAMQFTDEIVWDLTDFVVAGFLLCGAGLTYELIARTTGNVAYRIAVGIAVAAGLFLIWSNLAVGLIGSEENPVNLVYAGVLAVGTVGAILARLQSGGMARALFATAVAQVAAPVIALIIWRPQSISADAVTGIVFLNVFFAAMWVISALLFQKAAREQLSASAAPE